MKPKTHRLLFELAALATAVVVIGATAALAGWFIAGLI